MTIRFIDNDGNSIKELPDWDGEIPQRHDTIVLKFGDNIIEFYYVEKRIIDGTNSKSVLVVVHKILDKK